MSVHKTYRLQKALESLVVAAVVIGGVEMLTIVPTNIGVHLVSAFFGYGIFDMSCKLVAFVSRKIFKRNDN